jgi:Glycosyltransferase family 20/Polysaccharide deacetylase
MRFIVSLAAVLTPLSVGAFAFLPAERTIAVPALAIASPRVAPESRSVAVSARHNRKFAQVGAAETPGASGAPTRVEQEGQDAAPAGANSSAPNAPVQNVPAPTASTTPQCENPGGMGLARIVEIDTTGGPGFGFQHFKQYDFLHDKEVVLTFDDGPWPSTPAVLKALTDECLKATFFEIGEHATWHPEITKQVIDAGMTVGTHTWSHKHLTRKLDDRALIIGVDRLDYSKGIAERLSAFERFLKMQGEWRGKVTYLQIAPKSRTEIPEYADIEREIGAAAGRINGAYGEADWTPIRYVNRAYSRATLAGLI